MLLAHRVERFVRHRDRFLRAWLADWRVLSRARRHPPASRAARWPERYERPTPRTPGPGARARTPGPTGCPTPRTPGRRVDAADAGPSAVTPALRPPRAPPAAIRPRGRGR